MKVAASVFLSMLLMGATPPAIYESTGASFRYQIIPDKQFTRDDIVLVAKDLLAKINPKYKFTVLLLATHPSAVVAFRGPLYTEVDYETVIQINREDKRAPICRIVVWNGAASVLIRYSGGQIERFSLGGKDPLQFAVGDHMYEILNVNFARSPARPHFGYPNDTRTRFILRSQTIPSASDALTVWRVLASRTNSLSNSFLIRNSSFIVGELYPGFYPFSNEKPPSEEQYAAAPEAQCWVEGQFVKCQSSERGALRDEVSAPLSALAK